MSHTLSSSSSSSSSSSPALSKARLSSPTLSEGSLFSPLLMGGLPTQLDPTIQLATLADGGTEEKPFYQMPANKIDCTGLAPIHWAARTGSLERLQSLIECNANVNQNDKDGITPLGWAIKQEKFDCARLLIENGADLEGVDVSVLPSRESWIERLQQSAKGLIDHSIATEAEQLTLSFSYFLELPPSFAQLSTHLRQLSLPFNNLVDFPSTILSFVSLERLDLSNNLLTQIPPLGALQNLRTISLSGNFLSVFPPILKIRYLQSLDLSFNSLTEMPEEVGNLSRLVNLNISSNFLSSVPRSIVELNNLEVFSCAHNNITSMAEIPLHLFGSLRRLNISHNRITALPYHDLMSSSTLQTLRFLPNDFPKDIESIMRCFYEHSDSLDLSGLSLSSLRPEITLLTDLKDLNLRSNKLAALPPEIGVLTSLTSLDLSYNTFKDLPLFIRRLTNLKRLNLDETKLHLDNPPSRIVNGGLKSIMDYYNDLLSGEPCYRMKLMLVGQENVGKSTLLHALMNLKVKKRVKRGNISTDGIDIERWTCKLNNKQTLTFSAWDFAGQEIYYTTHSFFLSQKAIYLVVWDMRFAQEKSRVEFWLNSISTRCKDAPVILVATHLDDQEFLDDPSKVETRLQELQDLYASRFKNIKGITAVSATDYDGIATLMDLLKDIALAMPNMKELLPKIYLNLEEVIEEKRTTTNPPAITWPAFIKLAAQANFKDEEQLLRAVNFLNDLGSLMCFEDEKVSSDRLIVLDPQWLTSMFASVITTKHKLVKDGILLHDDLRQIWRPPQYPNDLHAHLLSLLQRFEILFELPNINELDASSDPNSASTFEMAAIPSSPVIVDSDGPTGRRFLLPSLLPEEAPPIDLLWAKVDTSQQQISRNYVLEFIPNGLFSRFIVRFLHYVHHPLKFWRYGVLAEKGTERALVVLDGKTVRVDIRGPQAPEMLRVVTEILNLLINSWFKVNVLAIEIPCPHCIQTQEPDDKMCKFSFHKLEETVATSDSRVVKCTNNPAVLVRLDSIVPDLAMTDFEGRKIDFSGIQLQKKLGKGSFGIIYRALLGDQVVAVKKLKADEDTQVEAFAEFRREVWLMSGLQHPCIVNLIGYTTQPLSMVMECVQGGDLFGFLHNPSIDVDWQLRFKIALDIANGMAFLHGISPPIFHRDMKSPNCLVADHRPGSPVVAKVADFGLSARLFVEKMHERVVENPTWCAPEVLQKKPYTEKADVYSYGIILWELVTRRLPFENYTFQFQVEDDVIRGVRPPIPDDCLPGFADLMRQCWDNNPAVRPPFDHIVEVLTEMIKTEIGEKEFRFPLLGFQRRKQWAINPLGSSSQGMLPGFNRANSGTGSPLTRGHSMTISAPSAIKGDLRTQLKTNAVPGGSFSCLLAVRNQIWCGDREGNISIFSTESGRLLMTYKTCHSGPVNVLLNVDQKVWSAGDDGNLIIWKVEDLVNETSPDAALLEGLFPITVSASAAASSSSSSDDKKKKEKKEKKEKKGLFGRKTKPKFVSVYGNGMLRIFKGVNAASGVDEEISLARAKLEAKAKSRFEICTLDKKKIQLQAKTDEEVQQWISEIVRIISRFSDNPSTQISVRKLNVGERPQILSLCLGEDTVLIGSNHNVIRVIDFHLRSKAPSTLDLSSRPDLSGLPVFVSSIVDCQYHFWAAVNRTLVRLDPVTYQQVDVLETKHTDTIKSVTMHANKVWTSGLDGNLFSWSLTTGECLQHVVKGIGYPLLTSIGMGRTALVVSGQKPDILTIDAETGLKVSTVKLAKHTGGITSMMFVFGLLWTASLDGSIGVWN